MSLKSREARKLAIASAAAIAALGAAASPAFADAQKQLTYSCSYPLIGPQPLTVDIDAKIPNSWPVNTKTEPWVIDVKATALGKTYNGLKLIGASTIEGKSAAKSTVYLSNDFDLPVTVPIVVNPFTVPAVNPGTAGMVLTAQGKTPAVSFPEQGPGYITVDSIGLTLVARDAAGAPIEVEDEEYAPDTDGDKTTLNIVCTLAPATQDTKLIDINVTGPVGDTTAPSVPGAGTAAGITTSGANLSWGASTDNAGGSGLKGYEYTVNGGAAVSTTNPSAALSGLSANTDYTVKIKAVDNAGNKSAEQTITFKTAPIVVADTTAPSVPGAGTAAGITQTGANVSWGASTDNAGGSGLKGYEYTVNGGAAVSTTAASVALSGLTANTTYTIKVKAVDNAGNKSAEQTVTFKTLPIVVADTTAPSVPGAGTAASITASGANVSWGASTDNAGGSGLKGYEYTVNGGAAVATTSASASLSGLAADSTITVKVKAVDNAGNKSAEQTITFKTLPGGGGDDRVKYGYNLNGTAALKNLTKGSVPLKGTIDALLDVDTGVFDADLVLNNTSANLTALGFLPVKASLQFVSQGKTTGTLQNGVLKSTSKVRIKLPSVTLFGIQLAGGANCQTRSASTINLQSTQPVFMPLSGGPIAGSFAISDLSGCGFLNGIVSPLTSGGGNTIAAVLSKK